MLNTNVMTERVLNTPQNKMNLQRHAGYIRLAEKVQREAGKTLSLEKKTCLATCLENTRQILESTNSSNIPSKTFFLDMLTVVVPNLIASDIVSTQAMDNKAGMISYLRFKYGTTKGKVTAGDVFNTSFYTGKSDPMYTARIIDAENEVFDSGKATLDYTPVLPGTVRIDKDGTTYVDDGAGHIIKESDGSTTKASINYSTGAFDNAGYAAGTASVSFDADDVFSYEYNNEQIPDLKAPEMSMELAQLPVYAKSRKLTAYWGFDAAYDLKKQYGQEIEDVISTQAAGEIAHEIDTEICLDLYNKAGAGTEIVWSKTAPIGVNIVDHYDSFWVKLTEGSKIIFGATQRVQPNFIVCGLNVQAVIECMRNFDGAGSSDAVGPHFFGTLGGRYKCYVVPQFDADVFVMGYKGSNFLETGYVYAPYMPLLTTDILMPADFRGQQGYATSYGKKMLNSRMYLKGRITD